MTRQKMGRMVAMENLANQLHAGAVCYDCGRTATEAEYSCGETTCCRAGVVPEEEFGKIDGFTGGAQ